MRSRLAAWALSALTFCLGAAFAPPVLAQATTVLVFDSQPGDYVGGGRKFTLTPADGTFTVSRNFDQGVSVSFRGSGSSFWYLDFAAPGPVPLVPGIYEGASRWPFQSPTQPGLDVAGEGRGCNELTGRFLVLEAVYDGSGAVQRFAADYEQHCKGAAPALFGSVRYNSAVSLGPRLSVSRPTIYEGDTGTGVLNFVASLSGPAAQTVTVQYRTQDGGAVQGADYVAVAGTVVIPAGQTAVTVPVIVIGDTETEGDETFFLLLENAQGAPLAFAQGVGTIVDDDPYKTYIVFDSQPGDWIGLGRKFTLTPIDGNITAPRNYSNGVHIHFEGDTWWDVNFAAPQQATITPGIYEAATRWPFQSPMTPGLDVSGDGRGCNKLTGRFVVLEAVYDAFGAVQRFAADYEQHCEGGAPALFGSVRFNSSVPRGPRLSVSSKVVYEGDFGTTSVPFVVSIPAPLDQPVTVQYRTQDAAATEGVDYRPVSGTLEIPPGLTSVTVPIGVIGDSEIEADETFLVVLENPQGAALAFGTGVGTIVNDDPDKTLLLFDSQPGDWVGGGSKFTLTPADGNISAQRGSDKSVTVSFLGADQWSLVFAAPDGAELVPGTYENAARYPFQPAGRPGLSVSGAGRGCNTLTGRFVVREAAYGVSGEVQRLAVDYEQHCEGLAPALLGSVRFKSAVALPLGVYSEGSSALESAPGVTFLIRLSAASASPVTVDYATVDGSAIGDWDYVRSFGTLTIPAGALEATVTVPIIDDAAHEQNETFGLEITRAVGARILGSAGTGTILDDDPLSVVSLGGVAVREGDPGRPGLARLPLTLDRPSGQAVVVTYATASGTAAAGEDFVPATGSVAIGAGQTSATVDVPLVADLRSEGDETFSVTLTSVTGGLLGVDAGIVTIQDDDGPTDFYTVSPCRLLDSRLAGGPIPAEGSLTFSVGGECGIPATAKAVVLNVTAVAPPAQGHLRIAPAGTPRPPTSTLNFVAGVTRAAGPVVTTLGANDAVTLHCVMAGAGATHVVVDVNGYFE